MPMSPNGVDQTRRDSVSTTLPPGREPGAYSQEIPRLRGHYQDGEATAMRQGLAG